MTALRYFTASFFAASLGYAAVTQRWWIVFTVLCAVLAWLPSHSTAVLVIRGTDDERT